MDFASISSHVTLGSRGLLSFLEWLKVFGFCERWSTEVFVVLYLNPNRSYSPSEYLSH